MREAKLRAHKKPIKRVIIIGDSMSDIGRMLQERYIPGSLSGVCRTGRFSDGRNWVDFLWAYMTGYDPGCQMYNLFSEKETQVNSTKHMRLTGTKTSRSGHQLVSYAEGGAVANPSTSGVPYSKRIARSMLASIDQEVDLYLKERASLRADAIKNEETLHIIWAGANDLVTVNCSTASIPAAAASVVTQAERILAAVPGSEVMVIDLPSLDSAARFIENDSVSRGELAKRSMMYDVALESHIRDSNLARGSHLIKLFKLSENLTPKEMGYRGFDPFAAQSVSTRNTKTSPAVSLAAAGLVDRPETLPLLRYEDIGVDENSKFAYTSDQLHPTEQAHREIFSFARTFMEQYYHIGGI